MVPLLSLILLHQTIPMMTVMPRLAAVLEETLQAGVVPEETLLVEVVLEEMLLVEAVLEETLLAGTVLEEILPVVAQQEEMLQLAVLHLIVVHRSQNQISVLKVMSPKVH